MTFGSPPLIMFVRLVEELIPDTRVIGVVRMNEFPGVDSKNCKLSEVRLMLRVSKAFHKLFLNYRT